MLMRPVAFVGEPQKVARPRCPICGACDLKTILTAADQPALLNRGYRTPAAAKCAARACLDFRGCQRCGFAFNAAFDGDLASYGPGYVNDQSCSPAFYDHLMDALGRMKEMIAGRCGQVVEVGCGQGSFLRFLCEATHRTGIGFDPACEIPFPPDLDADRAVRLKPFLFTSDDAEVLADDEEEVALIVCRHVLEHLPDPVGMLRLLRQVSAAHDAPICLEIPDWKWISDHDAFFEFFHEHCSLFDRNSMSVALAAAGLRPLRMESGFAEQFLLVEAMSTAAPSPKAPSGKNHDAAEMPRLDGAASCDFDDAAVRMDAAAQRTRQFLNEARKEGPVVLWGAGAKAVSVLNHLRLDGRAIQAVVDVNPAKHHHFLPLTGHRVIPPRELPALIGSRRGRPTIVVMNPCYADEIAQCIERLGVKASLHTLTDPAREPVHG
jgi:SAM-dependent methyltransferase